MGLEKPRTAPNVWRGRYRFLGPIPRCPKVVDHIDAVTVEDVRALAAHMKSAAAPRLLALYARSRLRPDWDKHSWAGVWPDLLGASQNQDRDRAFWTLRRRCHGRFPRDWVSPAPRREEFLTRWETVWAPRINHLSRKAFYQPRFTGGQRGPSGTARAALFWYGGADNVYCWGAPLRWNNSGVVPAAKQAPLVYWVGSTIARQG